MPQLIKGGKYVFGWCRVGKTGLIHIPPETVSEYKLKVGQKVILTSGSRRSGGFSLITVDKLKNSKLGIILTQNRDLFEFQTPEGEPITIKNRVYSWIKIQDGYTIKIPLRTLEKYGIDKNYLILCIRGSGIGPGFGIKGPIIEEARKHPEIKTFE